MRKVALRGLLARRTRLVLTALAVALGVMLMSGTFVFTDSFNRSFERIFETSYANVDVVVTPGDAGESVDGEEPPMPASVLERVRAVDGIEEAEGGIFSFGVVYLDKDGERIGGQGPPSFIASAFTAEALDAFEYVDGRAPEADGEIAIDRATARRFDFAPGDRIQVQGDGPKESFRVVGVATLAGVDSFGGGTVGLTTLSEAQRVSGKVGEFDEIDATAADGVDPEALAADVRAAVGSRYDVRTGTQEAAEQTADIQEDLGFVRTALFAFAGIALFVGAFGIFNTFSITVAQRARELALLRTLGASRAQVLRSVVAEGAVLGVLGAVVGAVAGVGVAVALRGLLGLVGFDLPSSGTVVEPRTILVSVLVGTLVTLAATVVPAVRATRIPPVEALREGIAPVRRKVSVRATAVASVLTLLGVAGIALGIFVVDDEGGALSLVGAGAALVFLGVALLSPRLVPPLAAVLGWAPHRFGGVAGRLARENTTRQPGRTAVTAAALMVGVALVTFASVFAASANKTISGYIDTGLRADLVIQNTDGFSGFTSGAKDLVARDPSVERVGGLRFAQTQVEGDPEEERSVDGVDERTFGELYALDIAEGGDDVLQRLDDRSVLLDVEYAEERGVDVGGSITVTGANGKRTLEVIGLTDDKANLLAPVVVTAAFAERELNARRDTYVFVDLEPGTDAEAAKAALDRRLLEAYPQVEALTAEEFKDDQAGQINQLLSIIYALLALAIIVSLFGIVNTLALSITERTRELGLLRAVGMTRWQVRRLITFEAVTTALIGGLLGTVVGVVLATLVSQAIEDFTLSFPVVTLIAVLVVAAVAGVLAAILPARRAARLDVLHALSYE